jgi:hypothetical protein
LPHPLERALPMSVPSDGFGGGGGRGEESGWRRPRPRAGAGPQRSCVGPCFTSVVECCCFPRAVMVPRDLQDVHPCNLTLQRQKAHQAAQNGTWRHSGTLRGTRWTPAHSEKKSLDPLRGPRTGAFSLVRMPSIPRQPFPPVAGPSGRTPPDASEQHRTPTYNYSLLLTIT